MVKRLESVVVYCGASNMVDLKYLKMATDIGLALAEAKINVVYGGGEMGLMGAMAKAAHDNGVHVTAVIPPFFSREPIITLRNRISERIRMLCRPNNARKKEINV
jgi:predicted Rossmann-fold nucleotide-binding protein